MQKRLAQKGPNAGNHFWGCEGFPRCRGTLSLDGDASSYSDSDACVTAGVSLPRPIVAEGITPDHRAVFIDTTALPRWLVKALSQSRRDPLAGYAWRLDLPTFEPDRAELHPGVSATYSFLLRGALTCANESLLVAAGLEVLPTRDEIERQLDALPPYITPADAILFSKQVFDSDEERMFYDAFSEAAAASKSAVSIIPQVGFQTLAPNSDLADAGFRVDFVAVAASGKATVIEIDGEQHRAERENDARRDAAIKNAGISVVRISASRIREDALTVATKLMAEIGSPVWQPPDTAISRLRQLAQLQIAIVASMRAGLIRSLGCVPIQVKFADPAKQLGAELLQTALEDLGCLLRDMARARGDTPPHLALSVACDQDAFGFQFGSAPGRPDRRTVYIHDTLIFAPPLIEFGPAEELSGKPIDRDAARNLFQRCYGFTDFRPGQFESIERVIRGLDTLLLLPTGAGKSATYQFATLIRGGVCVVVDPLLSLIDDQIQNLRGHGVDRSTQVSSQIEAHQRASLMTLLCQGHTSFVFVSPERLQQPSFREVIQVVALRRGIALIAIDEAHCVSQWGHDFRPAYLNVAKVIRSLSQRASGRAPPVIAMTGTASYAVLRDIQREINITSPDAQITPHDFDRPELRFEIVACESEEKGTELTKFLVGLHGRFHVRDPASFWSRRKESPITGLVFCPHVNGPHGTVDVANTIRRALPSVAVATHSGKPPQGTAESMWRNAKREAAAQFKRDDVQILACTNSFGMGIDKPNIRFTVHWGIPQSIESFYQEAGRAGRGRVESWCVLIVSDDNPRLADEQLASRERGTEPSRGIKSDVDRQLWFHRGAFPDAAKELAQLRAFIEICTESRENVINISFAGDFDRQTRERAVYRLILIGVARDYTVDWRLGFFQVHVDELSPERIVEKFASYVCAFNAKRGRAMRAELEVWMAARKATSKEVALHAGERLISFTYDQIEGTRRRALSEMRRVAKDNVGDEDAFRRALLSYLGASAFSSMLRAVVDDATGGLELVPEILDRIESPLDAADLASQAARLLASIYDQPILLSVRAIALLGGPSPNPVAAAQDLALAFDSAPRFEIDPQVLVTTVDAAVRQLTISDTILGEIACKLTTEEPDQERAKRNARLLANSEREPLSGCGISFLASGVLRSTVKLLETLKYAI